MRTEIKVEMRGERYHISVKGRREGKRATEQADGVGPADIASTVASLLQRVEERLEPKEV